MEYFVITSVFSPAIIETLILQIYHNEGNVLVSLKSLNLSCTLTPLTHEHVHI